METLLLVVWIAVCIIVLIAFAAFIINDVRVSRQRRRDEIANLYRRRKTTRL